ncbi:unnamed protein product [Eretmochelys imbricata]
MAAVVAALARLHPALAILGSDAQCHSLAPWYFLLGLRLVALFVADGPWASVKPDLACNWTSVNGDSQPFCAALCYNQRFRAPISSFWGFAFLATLLPMGLMLLIHAQFSRRAAARGDKESAGPTDATNMAAKPNMAAKTKLAGEPNMATGANWVDIINMDSESQRVGQSKMATPGAKMAASSAWRSPAFGLCVVLLLATELGFLWAMLALQLPLVSGAYFQCRPGAPPCPPALECALSGQADKKMALVTLAFTACVNIASCLAYGIMRLGRAAQCQRR